MDLFVLAAVAVLSAMVGFWLGKSLQWKEWDDEETAEGLRIARGREVGSPAGGVVSIAEENGKTMVKIMPVKGKVYAPVAGRVAHLYPMGSAMILKTDFGAELSLEIGAGADEMCSDFFRCRVIEHEVVKKGALILEYDLEKLQAEGISPEICLGVQNTDLFEQTVSATGPTVKIGEPVLYLVGTVEEELVENYRHVFS